MREVEVRGNRRIEADAIRARIHTAVGEEQSNEQIRSDILSIFGLGYFEHVEAEEESTSNGVRILFKVVEKPVVVEVHFNGLSEFDADELRGQIETKAFEVLDIHKNQLSTTRMLQMYEEKGFYLADVRSRFELDEAKNQAVVTFDVVENDKVQVKQIQILGNTVVPDSELKKYMQTQEGGPFSWITGSGSYREAIFERDLAGLTFYYGTLGYVKARFEKPEVTVTPDRKYINITFAVNEGDQFRVGKVDFSGDLLYARTELLSELELKEGEIFNTDTLRRETLKYTEKYSDLGYAFANVIPQYTLHDDTKTVDVTFEVDRGQRVYIGVISITGNSRTKDKVVRRELRILEGELYNGSRKRISRENIMRLGFFDNVEFNEMTNKKDPSVVDIEIKVKERSTGQLVIGAGYANNNVGFNFQANLAQNNFLGNGQIASLSANVVTGRNFYQFELGFTEPYVGSSLWSLGGSLYQLRRQIFSASTVPTFDEIKTGFEAKLGHPVLEFTNLFVNYKLEKSDVIDGSIIDTSLIPKDSVTGYTSSATGSLVYDKRDDRFDPRKGLYASVSSEFAGIGGTRKFARGRANLKFYHPIVWDFIFRFNLAGGMIEKLGGAEIPINELFIQGGMNTLRGYNFLSVGPKVTLSPAGSPNLSAEAARRNLGGTEIVLGGTREVLMQSEIEFPLLKEARIRGVVFFDAGNAFNDWSASNPKIFANYGWGIRWFTPVGPLRFEFGYPIVGETAQKFVFSIGPPF